MGKFFHLPTLFLKRNASTILTFIGAGGVIATSVMAVKATPKALKLLECAKEQKGEELTTLEKIQVAGPAYIPAAVTGASTIACIFGANVLNKRNQAALVSAYALLDSTYKKYRAKVDELYGENSDKRVIEELAKDDLDEEYCASRNGLQLFYDTTSMRYFESTVEDVQMAEFELNKRLLSTGYAALNHFYGLLDVPSVDYGDRVGWTTYARGWQDGCLRIDFDHHKVILDDGLECYMLYILTEPSMEYLEY